jgi:DNA-binding transcriptional regulator YiaG
MSAAVADELREVGEVGRLVAELPETGEERIALRRRVGWSRGRLAALLGVSADTLRSFERGALPRSITQTDALPRLCLFYRKAAGA